MEGSHLQKLGWMCPKKCILWPPHASTHTWQREKDRDRDQERETKRERETERWQTEGETERRQRKRERGKVALNKLSLLLNLRLYPWDMYEDYVINSHLMESFWDWMRQWAAASCTEVIMKVNLRSCDDGNYDRHHHFSQGLAWGCLQFDNLAHSFFLLQV